MKKAIIAVVVVLVVAVALFLGYVSGIYTGTARYAIIAGTKLIPSAHQLRLQNDPAAAHLLDQSLEEIVLDLRSMEGKLGKKDRERMSQFKAFLKKYYVGHPDALKNKDILGWLDLK